MKKKQFNWHVVSATLLDSSGKSLLVFLDDHGVNVPQGGYLDLRIPRTDGETVKINVRTELTEARKELEKLQNRIDMLEAIEGQDVAQYDE